MIVFFDFLFVKFFNSSPVTTMITSALASRLAYIIITKPIKIKIIPKL